MFYIPNSDCAAGVAAGLVKAFDKEDLSAAENLLRDIVSFGRKEGAARTFGTADIVANAFIDTVARVGKEPVERGLTSSWTTKMGFAAAAKPGTKGTAREALNLSVMHQHRRIRGEVSVLAQTRAFFRKKPADAFSAGMLAELTTRLNVMDGLFRTAGIPAVTMKAGGEHVSHLTTGDIFKILASPTSGKQDLVIKAFLRTGDAEKNIPLQNLQEAVRRIVEHNDSRLPFAGEELSKLSDDVFDALANPVGKPLDADAAAAMERTRKWVNSDEGKPIVVELRNALVDPEIWPKLIQEDLVQRQLALVFQRADGVQMAKAALDGLADVPWTGDKIEGLGILFFEDGLKQIFGDDFMYKLSPDGVNLAFGQQHLAKVLQQLAPENIAHIKEVYGNLRASRADFEGAAKGAKKPHTKKNKARKQKNDEIGEASQKMAEDQVNNDPNVGTNEPSREAGVIAQTFYNELKYGSVVGGLSKALSFVSDRATMTSKGKTILLGTEHIRLESAGTVIAGLRKLNDAMGQDADKANQIFNIIKENLGKSDNSIETVLGMVDEADRAAAKTMIDYIDAMFGAGDNNALMQNGIFVEELASSLRAVGLDDAAELYSNTVHADEILDYWRNFSPADGENILDYMGRFYSAQQISMIPPTMADSLARHFSHTAEGISGATAKKEGWFALDSGSPLGKYMTYNAKDQVLFPPEFRGRIKAIEDYLTFDRSLPSGTMGEMIRKIDQVTSVLKSSITLWRPGHHMVSMIGNVFMNALADVRPYDYGMAMKLLYNRKSIIDVDDAALNELMRLQAPAGTKLKDDMLTGIKVPIKVNGKVEYQTLDLATINLAMERTGSYINPRRVRDIVTTDDLGSGAFSASRLLTKNPIAKGVQNVDHEIATVAAYRDNVARAALFVKELRKMDPKASLEDAFLEAASRVHEYHPTVGTLTAGERKYARRLFYFYTWQKQAFFKILEVTANKPALVTIPSKLQFAIATSQGLDPHSFGDPYSAQGWFAAYNSSSLYGPQWDDPQYGAMGIKPPIPQLDTIDSYLSGIRVKPEDGLWGNIGNLASQAAQDILVAQASPALRVPAELALGTRTTTRQEITNVGEYAIDQTGFGALSRIYDWTPWGPRTDTKLDPYSDFNRDRQWWNYLAGMKITAYESPASLQTARQEAVDYYRKKYKTGRYAPRPSLAEWRAMQEGTNE
jgi:hypothetical protein